MRKRKPKELYPRPNSPYWWMRVNHKGKKIRESTGIPLDQEEAAQRHLDEFKASLWKDGPIGSCRSWSDAVVEWADKRPRSNQYVSRLRIIERYIRRNGKTPKSLLLREIKTKTFTPFFNSIHNLHYKNTFIRQIVAILNNALNEGMLEDSPEWKMPKWEQIEPPEVLPKWINKEIWDVFCEEAGDYLLKVCRFLAASGLRKTNGKDIKKCRIDRERRIAYVDGINSKSRKIIAIPLSDEAMEIVNREWSNPTEYLFPYKDTGKPMGDFKKHWNKAKVRTEGRLGIKLGKFTPHCLRHCFACWHVINGTPIDRVQAYLGHSSAKSTKIYTNVSVEHLTQFVNNAKPVSIGHTKWAHKQKLAA